MPCCAFEDEPTGRQRLTEAPIMTRQPAPAAAAENDHPDSYLRRPETDREPRVDDSTDQAVLVEREETLARLTRTLELARHGSGGLTVLEGVPGIGKTRCLQAAAELATADGFDVRRSRGADTELGFAFGGALQLFDGIDPGSLNGAAALADPVLRGDFLRGEGGSPQSAIHGLFWLCVNLATERPLALVIDDLHAIDDQTLAFLGYTARRIRELRLAVIAATRPAPGAPMPPLAEFSTPEIRCGALQLGADAAAGRAPKHPAPTSTASGVISRRRRRGVRRSTGCIGPRSSRGFGELGQRARERQPPGERVGLTGGVDDPARPLAAGDVAGQPQSARLRR
jgi:hypothetical protein